ncbi:MAG: PfkB family carbohydrate kinase, partial [Pseudomonadota bacterium]
HASLQVKRAVTSTSIDQVSIDDLNISNFISNKSAIVCDLGMNANQLSVVLDEAGKSSIPVICNGTSDGRISRIQNIYSTTKFYALVMNRSEAKTIIENFSVNYASKNAKNICEQCHASAVVITLSERGMLTLFEDGSVREHPAYSTTSIVSTVGAGDAMTACLTAAVASRISQNDSLEYNELDDCFGKMKRIMPTVLSIEGSTNGCDQLFSEKIVTQGFGKKRDDFFGV